MNPITRYNQFMAERAWSVRASSKFGIVYSAFWTLFMGFILVSGAAADGDLFLAAGMAIVGAPLIFAICWVIGFGLAIVPATIYSAVA